MPRIDDVYLDCVIYLYPSVEDANRGERAGGSGFLTAFQSEHHPDRLYVYAVTNAHVVRGGTRGGRPSPVIRLNRMAEDAHAAIPLAVDNWLTHPDGDDLAVAFVSPVDRQHFYYTAVSVHNFLTVGDIRSHNIGPGDDVFMVGRFVTHEGRQRNLPTVRFGTISMMPFESVRHPSGIMQESFLVETRSLGGYSGSPVFVYIPRGAFRPGWQGWDDKVQQGTFGPRLLGVDWGHLPDEQPVLERVEGPTGASEWRKTSQIVRSNSGMSAVVPSWRLWQLLHDEELVRERNRLEREFAERKQEANAALDSVDAAAPARGPEPAD